MARVDAAVAALADGLPVVLPTDTVYGLCASAHRKEAVRRLYELKRRPASEPIAVLAADVEMLLDTLPELGGRSEALALKLLPGPYTFVLRNPVRHLPWLTGATPEAVGVRVPELNDETRAVIASAGAVAATSANFHGGVDPRRLADIPDELRRACGAVLDGGDLPGRPSTVIDVTGAEPRVLREGAVPADQALAQVRAALT